MPPQLLPLQKQEQEQQHGEELVPARPSRAVMYALVSLQGLPNWVIRNGTPSWIPFVVADLGLSSADRALLLASWYPGYLVSQIPGAALIDRIGPKFVMGGNMLGTCGLFLLLPAFVKIGGGGQTSRQVQIVASTLTICGFFQGPLIPGQQVMRRNWLPQPGSPARPIHMKLISLGGLFSELLASSVTPIIAGSLGWRAVNVVMGGGGLLCALCWFLFAKSKPTHFRRRGDRSATLLTLEQVGRQGRVRRDPMTHDDNDNDTSTEAKPVRAPSTVKGRSSPLALFKHPAVVATLWCKMASGNMNYTTTQWTPTYFVDVLGCTPIDTAKYLVWRTPINIIGGFAVAAAESRLLQSGVSQLSIRKHFQTACVVGRSLCLILFGLARSPSTAAIFINLETVSSCLMGAGFSPNMIEVGGKQTATMNGVGNTVRSSCNPPILELLAIPRLAAPLVVLTKMANAWGLLVPIIGAASTARFGSYMPLFLQSIVVNVVGAILFSKYARLTSPLEDHGGGVNT